MLTNYIWVVLGGGLGSAEALPALWRGREQIRLDVLIRHVLCERHRVFHQSGEPRTTSGSPTRARIPHRHFSCASPQSGSAKPPRCISTQNRR
jgi:hypothetical protein